jgi:hypothetical protein
MTGAVTTSARFLRRLSRIAGGVLSLFCMSWAIDGRAATAVDSIVWFNPAPQSPDYLDLFLYPESWAETRKRINVFAFNPAQLGNRDGRNSFADLARVDAFRKLRLWGIDTAIGVAVVKEWDCNARKTPAIAVGEIKEIHEHGGKVDFVTMDEPLVAGLGVNNHTCRQGLDEIADEAAAFVQRVQRSVSREPLGPAPKFIEIEPYPSVRLDQHEAWVDALIARGFQPAAYHVDIAIAQVERHPELKLRFAADLRTLKSFLDAKHIPFGIIFWSSHAPVRSDKEYFDDTISFTRRVYSIVGRPAQIVFASWAMRCAGLGKCQKRDEPCPGVEPSACRKMSVPLNLPESGSTSFSHTRLVLTALNIMGQH